jgi:putative membrane protein (TIGR04086 family)
MSVRSLLKPVLIGAVTYVPLYALLWAMYQLPEPMFQNQWLHLLFTVYGLVMLPTCGYISARVSKQHGLFVGSACGVVIALATVAVSASIFGQEWYGESLLVTALGFVIRYAFYSALGGGLGELHARTNKFDK